MSLNPNVIAAITIELTKKIEKYQKSDDAEKVVDGLKKNDDREDEEEKEDLKQDEDEDDNESEEELSEITIKSLMIQFDKLVGNILNRLGEYSFFGGSSHEHSSPFTITGLKNDDNMNGISTYKRAKQSQYAFDIYEIFSIYFEKSLRIQQSIETRFKQSRMMMKYFENICKTGQSDKIKDGYLKVVHILNRLIYLYSSQIKKDNKDNDIDDELDINKMEQMLTSIQLVFNRTQRLSDKLYIDLKESKELTENIENMEKLTYEMKNKSIPNDDISKPKETISSAFADWM